MSERLYGRLLAAGGLALACLLALRAPGVGDYPTDAGPALTAIAHGDLFKFFSHQPAMGSLSLFVRAPFTALAVALGDGPLGLYRWGDLPCLLAVAAAAVWIGRVARRRGSGRVAPVVILALAMLNPLVHDALYYGHPEELLTGGLAAAALLAACEQRALPAAVLAGLAVAGKQWALLIIPPVILVLERERVRALVLSGATALAATLPMALGSPAGFRHALSYISHPQPVVTLLNWLYPLSPAGDFRISNIFGDSRLVAAHRLLGIESTATRPAILLLGLGIPLYLWWRAGARLTPERMLLATSLVLILRCALDPGSAAYYEFPVILTLLALDAWMGRKLPLAGLAAAAAAFVVLDRFPAYLTDPAVNAAYIATTAIACLFLATRLGSLAAGATDRASAPEPLSSPLPS